MPSAMSEAMARAFGSAVPSARGITQTGVERIKARWLKPNKGNKHGD